MKLWNKIKQMTGSFIEKQARKEVRDFVFEIGYFDEFFPENLKKRKERLTYKQNLTATYAYGSGEDKLSKKQDFIDQYTINEQEQRKHFTFEILGPTPATRCKVWRDHEQVERCEAQKAWRVVQHRNHREHMRQKFMNQKTR